MTVTVETACFIAGLLICYLAFVRVGKARNDLQVLAWAAVSIIAAFAAAYSLIVLVVGSV